jgi:DNA-binding CsgD family transcriptional regulator/tetratricopeptide (TPR) repeat protein
VGTTLVERHEELTALAELAEVAASGSGRVALIFGEAGIGKTSVLQELGARLGDRFRVLVGTCDDLLTARTLGPIRDIAAPDGRLARSLQGVGDREEVLSALLDELKDPPKPTVLIIEDAHWADDATLDALGFVARRIHGLALLLVVTFRDDEIDSVHPLGRVLGALSGRHVLRLPLHRLSRDAVAELAADQDRPADEVFAITSGNPFFVTEVLSSGTVEVPLTVRDAVLSRLHALPSDVRSRLEILSVIPGHVEMWLVEALVGNVETLVSAEQQGLVVLEGSALRFRHELSRRAVEGSLPATRRIAHNRTVLACLAAREDADPSRVMHHAVESLDVKTILSIGPIAARMASAVGGHREAASHYAQVLQYLERLEPEELATILTAQTRELYLLQRFDEAGECAQAAVTAWERLGEDQSLGEALSTVSWPLYWSVGPKAALEAAGKAVEILDAQGPSESLARAYGNYASLCMMADQPAGAAEWGARAVDLAESLGLTNTLVQSLSYMGAALLERGDSSGWELIDRSVQMAPTIHDHEIANRALMMAGRSRLRYGRFSEARPFFDRTIEMAREHEFISAVTRGRCYRYWIDLVTGEWDTAEAGLDALLAEVGRPGPVNAMGFALLGRLRARLGADSQHLLETASQVGERYGEVLLVGLASTAEVEAAWLAGDPVKAERLSQSPLRLVSEHGHEWFRGELLRYLARAGIKVEQAEGCAEPYALGLKGQWREAAAAWSEIGNPYERALELADSGEVDATLEALDVLDELGAIATARVVRRRLRALGVMRIPRGRKASTRGNPAGLTDRQVEVLALLGEGLSNSEIADRLVVSIRTVDHHVSAILGKLGVETRKQAARAAQDLGVDHR